MAKNGTGRTRNWATIVYPESAPEDWKEILQGENVAAFISPFHDKDKNPDGTPKKGHFHVLLMFEGVKTQEQVAALVKKFSGVGTEKVNSVRGYARYLCHMDNPEKHQYPTSEVTAISGADYMGVISLASDKYKAIREMITYCKDNGITAYDELLEYAAINREDWFKTLCDNGTMVIVQYLKSRAWHIAMTLKAKK